MVKLYLKKIQEGAISIDDVPSTWRDKVQAELDKVAEENLG